MVGECVLILGTEQTENVYRHMAASIPAFLVISWRIQIAFAKAPEELPKAHFPGLANRLTILRGLLVCTLAGFLFQHMPEGRLAWLPGLLFIATLIIDGLDGWIARRRGETTAFGVFLDRDFDALGTLIAILLAVHYSRLPDWYIAMGMVYYLFSFGQWLREKSGLPLYPLPASRYRRVISVLQSTFIAAALLPLPLFPTSSLPALLVSAPVLAGFIRDWRSVSGYDWRAFSTYRTG